MCFIEEKIKKPSNSAIIINKLSPVFFQCWLTRFKNLQKNIELKEEIEMLFSKN